MDKHKLTTQMGLGELLSSSWNLWTKHFQPILIITLVVYIPINIVLYFAPNPEANVEGIRQYLRAAQILELFIGIISTMAVAHIVYQSIEHKKEISFIEALQKSFSRYISALGTQLLMGIFLVLLLLLLIVPSIYFAVLWSFALYAVIFKDKVFKSALDDSYAIVKGRWWFTFGRFLAIGLIAVTVGFSVGLVSWLFPNTIVFTVITDTFIDVIASYFLVVQTVLYLNMDATRPEVEEK